MSWFCRRIILKFVLSANNIKVDSRVTKEKTVHSIVKFVVSVKCNISMFQFKFISVIKLFYILTKEKDIGLRVAKNVSIIIIINTSKFVLLIMFMPSTFNISTLQQ